MPTTVNSREPPLALSLTVSPMPARASLAVCRSSATSDGPLGRRPDTTFHTESSPSLIVPPSVGAVGRSSGLPSRPMTTTSSCTNGCASATPGTAATVATTSSANRSRVSKPKASSTVFDDWT